MDSPWLSWSKWTQLLFKNIYYPTYTLTQPPTSCSTAGLHSFYFPFFPHPYPLFEIPLGNLSAEGDLSHPDSHQVTQWRPWRKHSWLPCTSLLVKGRHLYQTQELIKMCLWWLTPPGQGSHWFVSECREPRISLPRVGAQLMLVRRNNDLKHRWSTTPLSDTGM